MIHLQCYTAIFLIYLVFVYDDGHLAGSRPLFGEVDSLDQRAVGTPAVGIPTEGSLGEGNLGEGSPREGSLGEGILRVDLEAGTQCWN